MIDEKDNLLYLPSFNEPVCLEGKSYWDSHSKIWSLIRIPAKIKMLYPQLTKEKLKFEIRCFPNKQKLQEHLEKAMTTPMLLNLCIDKQK